MAKHAAAGYYFEVSVKEVGVAGGIYLPPPESLKTMRRHFADHHEEFRAITGSRHVQKLFGELQGERLARVPKGWPACHPAADILRYKQCYLYAALDSSIATTPRLFSELIAHFRAMTPLLDFLNEPLVAANRRKGSGKSLPLARI
jgi:uncharacterized protein (TIGR02453 family)